LGRAIVHYEIPADDIEKLKKFYSDCFGWKFKKFEMPGHEYWLFTSGKNSPGGGMMKKQHPGHRPVNYVHVASVDEAIQTVQTAGGTITLTKQEIPGTGFFAIGADPEGNPVGLFEMMRPARKQARKKATKKKRKTRR
jgi:predicted enzyme related to lactoylglutathione lyase